MKAPESLETLVDYGIIEDVIRPLMSGKEAQVYVVMAGGEECVAKVYKEANQRTFKHRSDYTEGRRTRNTRDQRAMNKRTQHGRKKDEDAWRNTEVEMIYRLREAGVRVPDPINFVDGVLVMELVKDAAGQAAPRLGDLTFSAGEAKEIYQGLIREVVRMLNAGVIHGDLSDFNVLMSHDGPVLIDFPQSVDPTQNPNSQKLLLRDVENLHRFLARFAPDEPVRPYGEEIWSLYRANKLESDSQLTGAYVAPEGKADTQEVMALIEDANLDERKRRGETRSNQDEEDETSVRSIVKAPAPFRKVVDFTQEAKRPPSGPKSDGEGRVTRQTRRRGRRRNARKTRSEPAAEARDAVVQNESEKAAEAPKPASTEKRRRSRRGRRRVQSKAAAKSDDAAGQKGASTTTSLRAAPGKPRAPKEAAGTDGPARRRRRRPRKTTASE